MRKLSSSSQIEMVIKTFTTVANTTVTAKPKTSRQKQNTSRQNQNPHGKTKDLTAKTNTSQQKPNTSRQKQIPTAKPKLFCFCCEVFGFAVKFLVLPWRILFLPWGFWFRRDVFVFAVRFLVLPWQLWAKKILVRTQTLVGKREKSPVGLCLFVFIRCVVFCKKDTAARIAEPRSKKKMMGEVPRCFFLSPPPHCFLVGRYFK